MSTFVKYKVEMQYEIKRWKQYEGGRECWKMGAGIWVDILVGIKVKYEAPWIVLVLAKVRFCLPPPRPIDGRMIYGEGLGGRWAFVLLLGFHASELGWYDRNVLSVCHSSVTNG